MYGNSSWCCWPLYDTLSGLSFLGLFTCQKVVPGLGTVHLWDSIHSRYNNPQSTDQTKTATEESVTVVMRCYPYHDHRSHLPDMHQNSFSVFTLETSSMHCVSAFSNMCLCNWASGHTQIPGHSATSEYNHPIYTGTCTLCTLGHAQPK